MLEEVIHNFVTSHVQQHLKCAKLLLVAAASPASAWLSRMFLIKLAVTSRMFSLFISN